MWNEFLEKIFVGDLNKIKNKQNIINNYVSWLDDEIVKKSSFYPLHIWWASFKTHYLEIDNYWNIIIKRKKLNPILFIIAFGIPLFFNINDFYNLIIIKWFSNDTILDLIVLIFFSFFIPLLFIFLIKYAFVWKIFDFQNNYFYDLKNRNKLIELILNLLLIKKNIDIKSIYALQIIPERINYHNNNYVSYELNLILKDSSRVLVVDHWDLSEIRNNAQVISQKLNIKIYDLTTVLNG